MSTFRCTDAWVPERSIAWGQDRFHQHRRNRQRRRHRWTGLRRYAPASSCWQIRTSRFREKYSTILRTSHEETGHARRWYKQTYATTAERNWCQCGLVTRSWHMLLACRSCQCTTQTLHTWKTNSLNSKPAPSCFVPIGWRYACLTLQQFVTGLLSERILFSTYSFFSQPGLLDIFFVSSTSNTVYKRFSDRKHAMLGNTGKRKPSEQQLCDYSRYFQTHFQIWICIWRMEER